MDIRPSQKNQGQKTTTNRITYERQNKPQAKRHDKAKSEHSTTSSSNSKQIKSESIATKLLN